MPIVAGVDFGTQSVRVSIVVHAEVVQFQTAIVCDAESEARDFTRTLIASTHDVHGLGSVAAPVSTRRRCRPVAMVRRRCAVAPLGGSARRRCVLFAVSLLPCC